MKAIWPRLAAGLLGFLALAYVSDWAVWRVRVAEGGGMGTVNVSRVIVSPLKNGRDEFDWGGSELAPCSRSIFPQAGEGACWWLARHNVVYQQP